MFWAVFDYLERRRSASLFLLAAALSLHFSTKETAFIYAAQLLIVLAVLFVGQVVRRSWDRPGRLTLFLISVVASGLGGGLALVVFLRDRTLAREAATLTTSPLVGMGVVLAVAGGALAVGMLILNFGRRLRTDFPSLDLLIITGTLTLTQLGALPAAALGWDPLAYSNAAEWGRTGAMVVLVVLLAAGVGLSWNWRRWLVAAGIFFAIYLPLHTTLFTNPQGIATGMVGSLGYWLVQQGVQRGTQPLYYYLLIEIPIYEYLAALGTLVAGGMGIAALVRGRRRGSEVQVSSDPEFGNRRRRAVSAVLRLLDGERADPVFVRRGADALAHRPHRVADADAGGLGLRPVPVPDRRPAVAGDPRLGGDRRVSAGPVRVEPLPGVPVRLAPSLQRHGTRSIAGHYRSPVNAGSRPGGCLRRDPTWGSLVGAVAGAPGGPGGPGGTVRADPSGRPACGVRQLRPCHRVPGLRPLGRRPQAGPRADRRDLATHQRGRARPRAGL